jgi:hypothetical protein
LQKLLNITLLHDYGYKISKISSYPEEQIPVMVGNYILKERKKSCHYRFQDGDDEL